MEARGTDGDSWEGDVCHWEGRLLQGGHHLGVVNHHHQHLCHDLFLPPLHPGVVGEKGSEGEEDENDLGR